MNVLASDKTYDLYFCILISYNFMIFYSQYTVGMEDSDRPVFEAV